MTLEFQLELLKFLAQTKEARKYIPLLEPSIFDLPENQIVYELVSGFWKDYKGCPALANLLEYFAQEAKKTKLDTKVRANIEKHIRTVYQPLQAHTTQIRESILQHIQYKKAKLMFTENFDKLNDGVHVFKDIRKAMDDIIRLEDRIEGNTKDPKEGFLLASHTKARHKSFMKGMPTFLKKINGMTAIGGFCSPQLVLFMGSPKSFKTGTLLNVIMPYVRNGKKVYYADLENGEDDIKLRAAQYMAECTVEELQTSKEMDKVVEEVVTRYKQRGGDLYVKSYQAHVSTTADIEADLDMLAEDFGWTPDIIAIDYADLLKPVDKKITDKRLQIQSVYFDIKNMNNRRDVLTFTLSQVNKNAVDKKVINMSHFAEDFGKAANCDAAFAICQTKEERKVGIARLIPVVQRKGIQYTGTAKDTCHIKIEYPIQRIREMTTEQILKMLDSKTIAENPDLIPDEDLIDE